jgi:PAS domain S-box-containing protein
MDRGTAKERAWAWPPVRAAALFPVVQVPGLGRFTNWLTHALRTAQQLFGYTAEEMIGKSITTIIPTERHDEEPQILARIRRGDRIGHYETVRRRKDGSLVDVSLSVSPTRASDGKIVGASKIARDITERKRAEEKISLLAREAEHRARNVLATVQAVAHL